MSAWSPVEDPPPRLGRRMLVRFLLGGLVIALCAAGAVATALKLEIKTTIQAFERDSVPIRGVQNVLDDVKPGGPQTILLVGSDQRFVDRKAGKTNNARSDTMMLVRLDPDKKATAVMSIPRDLKVAIPGYGTDKINASFANGGPNLTVRTIRNLLGISINHVVNVNFDGFAKAVNKLGCVYVDVDRRYFNDNMPPAGGGGRYAAIDIQPGYQKLCGLDSLDYVRFRHLDDDFVRSARQQSYLEQAKQQVGVGRLFGDRQELLGIFGRYTQTDIRSESAILRLLTLTYRATQGPIREVQFGAGIDASDPSYVTIGPAALKRAVTSFLAVRQTTASRSGSETSTTKQSSSSSSKRTKKKAPAPLAPGLVAAKRQGEDLVAAMAARAGSMPVYYPAVRTTDGYASQSNPYLYTIRDRAGYKYRAYRIVGYAGENGQYWGVQGTTWRSPPILDDPTDTIKLRGRTYDEYYDGSRLRLIAWRTPRGVYWVSNTLLRTLTNNQMRDIAKSLTRVGQ